MKILPLNIKNHASNTILRNKNYQRKQKTVKN